MKAKTGKLGCSILIYITEKEGIVSNDRLVMKLKTFKSKVD